MDIYPNFNQTRQINDSYKVVLVTKNFQQAS